MTQKLLLFISILMLNSLFALAEEPNLPELPALPVTSEEEIVDNRSGKPKTFFEKIKSFFGFGDDANDDAITTELNAEEQAIDSTSTPLDQTLEEATEESPEITSTVIPPSGSTDEGPTSIMIPTLPVDDDTEDELKLPSGFDDDIKDSSENETPQVSKMESGREAADVLLPTSDDTEDELKLPSGFGEEFENKTDETKDLIEKKSDSNQGVLVTPEAADVSLPTSDDTEDKLELPSGFGEEFEDKTDKTKDLVEKKSDSDQSVPAALETLPEISNVGDSDKVENKDVVKVELPSAVNDMTTGTMTTESSGLPVPTYVDEAVESRAPETNISKYQKELQFRQDAPKYVQTIAPEELVANANSIEKFTAVTAAGLDNTQLQFVNNEAQVLILPNDEVVLGEVTQEAELDFMDFRLYVKIFWQQYDKIRREPKRMEIEQFIDNYDENFNEENDLYYEDEVSLGLDEAFKAIDKGNIYSLISLLNSYPILQLAGQEKNNLLHEASYVGNYPAARLLVLKGIDIFARNGDRQTALTIAERFNNKHIVFLLKTAELK